MILRVKTPNGMIELVNLPKDSVVLVDGAVVSVAGPGGGKPVVITVTAGTHTVMVKRDGIEISEDEVTVQADGKETFSVRFVASTKPAHELPKDDAADSTRTARKDARPDASPAIKTPSSRDSITNLIGMTLKLIPAGEFLMGSPDSDKDAGIDEKPQHRVRISKPFYLGVYEVTQAQYKAVTENSNFPPNGDGKDKVAGQLTDQYPVAGVSWFDAVIFCNKLSDKEGKKPFYEIDDRYIRVPDWNGPGYRLPTEAEWEYACRANASTPTLYSFGDDAAQLDEHGWFGFNSSRAHPVGKKKPNGFGLHDMHGNVSEWCWDWYGEGFYKQSREDDPTGPAGGPAPGLTRVFRGGGFYDGARRPVGEPHSAERELRRPGFPPGPESVWTLSSGGQGASGAGSLGLAGGTAEPWGGGAAGRGRS